MPERPSRHAPTIDEADLGRTLVEASSARIVERLIHDERFLESIARLVVRALVGDHASFAARTLFEEASAELRPAPRRRHRSEPVRQRRNGSVERVYAAIRDGATTRKAVCAIAGVSNASYAHARKMLKAEGRIKVLGGRRAARIVAA